MLRCTLEKQLLICSIFLTGNLPNMPTHTSHGPSPLGNQLPSPGHYNAPPPTSQIGYPSNTSPPMPGYGASNTPGAPSSYPPPPPQPGQPNQPHSGRNVVFLKKHQCDTKFSATEKNRIFTRVKIRYFLRVKISFYNTASFIYFVCS